MKIAIVVGTRPEIIKMASLIHECVERNLSYILIHSNQHFSPEMDEIFFRELKLPKPHYNLNIGSGMHGNQTGRILIMIEPILEKEMPDIIFTQGDTNTTLAAALAASKMKIKVAHIEAGLRSYDKTMPEETNRIVVDHSSDYLFAVTETQKNNLLSEGLSAGKIHVVGNTVADTLLKYLPSLNDTNTLNRFKLKTGDYALWTVHRAGNVDTKVALVGIVETLKLLMKEYDKKIVWPLHPRTKKRLEEFNLQLPNNVISLDPLGYFDFVALEKNADLIFTDSGGIQEEACILAVPCITLRENTERPESVDVGANLLVGNDSVKLINAIKYFKGKDRNWVSPFGDGQTAKKIIDIALEKSRPKNICVVGLGYMGLPFACLLAQAGHSVSGFDIDATRVNQINEGISPYHESGLSDLLKNAVKNHGMKASTSITKSNVYIISVPTPALNEKCDLTYVNKALESIGKVVEDGNLVILESTVAPNTCKDVILPFFEKLKKNVLVAFCPERAIPGQTIFELVHNDRIIGGIDDASTEAAFEIYHSFVQGKIFKTSATVAETAKLMENTFRDVNIALANEFSSICKELGISVWEAIELANKHPRVNILYPGPGVGGHCIAVDPYFLVEKSESAKLIRLAREINNHKPIVVAQAAVQRMGGGEGKKVGLLGVAYKKNVDDSRETPAEVIAEELKRNGIEVSYHDPYVSKWKHAPSMGLDDLQQWSDLLILVTDHDDFRNVSFQKPYLDTRNLNQSDSL